jgi:Skp family chaperone for outer membrane proteins
MLAWWAFQDKNQALLSLETVFEIEHIYARNRYEKEKSLSDVRYLESLGNKALLEKRINISAADYRFSDKKSYYQGYINKRKQPKEGTKIRELVDLADSANDFTETSIKDRNSRIMSAFLGFLKENDLLL